MPQSRVHAPSRDEAVARGLRRVREELEVPTAFAPAVLETAVTAVDTMAGGRVDRRDLPLVTIDPPGSRDLDQALTIEPIGGGHVVWYAIADVAAFVRPGDPVDLEARARAVTLYAPDGAIPLHPPSLSEGAASLLPGLDRPAVLWRMVLDPDGMLVETSVGRALVRSREQLTYAQAAQRIEEGDPLLVPVRDVGRRREAIERQRGGVSLPIPDQEVVRGPGGYQLAFRAPRPVEGWNAQLSLLCGMAAADLMLAGGWGLLRTLPPAPDDALALLRRQAVALGIDWPAGFRYADVIHGLDPDAPGAAAFLVQATRLFRGADYLPLRPDRPPPEATMVHAAIAAPYAHVTAPLRRLADRFASEAVLAVVAGAAPPDWTVDALDDLPGLMRSGRSRASALERAVVDRVEAILLADAVGGRYRAAVVGHRRSGSVVQLTQPAVVGFVAEELALGASITVEVVRVDPDAGEVELVPVL